MPALAFARASGVPDFWTDDDHLTDVTGATWHVWDDPAVDWTAYDLVVVRQTWDYTGRREAFLRWAASLAGRIENPAEVIAWNTDKRYLLDAQRAGLAVVPTAYLAPGAAAAVQDAGGAYVVKPSVSAGARDTVVFGPGAAEAARAAALVADIHRSGRTAMVQPHVASVDVRGETGLYFYGGAFSHAIAKGAVLERGADVVDDLGFRQPVAPREPSGAEMDLAERAVAWLAERFGEVPAYVRVDVVLGDANGTPQLLELELIEPSMWFAHAPAGAEERFAAVLRERAERAPRRRRVA